MNECVCRFQHHTKLRVVRAFPKKKTHNNESLLLLALLLRVVRMREKKAFFFRAKFLSRFFSRSALVIREKKDEMKLFKNLSSLLSL